MNHYVCTCYLVLKGSYAFFVLIKNYFFITLLDKLLCQFQISDKERVQVHLSKVKDYMVYHISDTIPCSPQG